MPARAPQKQPEPCSFVPSHSLLLNDPQRGALKSQKERNIASGQQANHFPRVLFPSSYPYFLLQDFSMGPTSLLVLLPPDSCRGTYLGSSMGPMDLQVSQSGPAGSLLRAACLQSRPLLGASEHLGWQAGVLWHLCSCLSLPVFLPPPRARSTLLLTQQVQPLALLCFFTPSSLESPAGLSRACFVPGWSVSP